MLRKLVLGAAVVLLPVGLVLGVAPGVASAASNPPAVNHVAPHHGPANGGTSVAITGGNFTDVTAVDFGGSAARGFSVVSHRVIIAKSPPGSGVVDITVTTSAGTSTAGKSDQFTYNGQRVPVVTNVVPGHGRPAGGTEVTILGNDLEGATSVQFGANAATAVTVFSHHIITAKSPAGSGTVDVTVTTPLGTSAVNRKDEFTYNTKTIPVVTHVTPQRGSPGGGTAVTIRGSNLTGATAVDFGGNAATGVIVITSHLVTATSPAGSGTVDVTVTTPLGTSATATGDQFTYVTVTPVVTHVAPHKGPAAGGTVVAVTGQNLGGATVVDFGSNAATQVRVISPKIVLATAPAGTGTVDVTVTTPLGVTAVNAKDQYTYR
jgi:hypothetical protein